jgi:hypothetical protein
MTEGTQQAPWYRHFWPWFIIVLLGMAVTASLYTLVIASQGNDSLVVDGDGGTDVVTERNMKAQMSAMDMGLSAELVMDISNGDVRVTLVSGSLPETPPTLELWLSHPTFADRDERTTVTIGPSDANGRLVWVGRLLEVPIGKRYVVLRDGDNWRLNGTWEGEPMTRLTAAGPDVDD